MLALVLGGGTDGGIWSEALIQFASLPLLMLAVWDFEIKRLRRSTIAALAIAAFVLLLPLIQLIPLPYKIWASLPGRHFAAEPFQTLGVSPGWLPLSLNPAATERMFYSLLPPLAVFLASLRLTGKQRQTLVTLLVGVALFTVFLGLMQLMQGPESLLRLYPITNEGSSVGFFANRNHFGALLFTAIPFVVARAILDFRDMPRFWLFRLSVYALLLAVLILGIGMSHSRAAAILGMAAVLLTALMVRRDIVGGDLIGITAAARSRWLLMGGALIGGVLVMQFALAGLLARFERPPLDDYRTELFRTTTEAAQTFQPVGSGLGTFVNVYALFERPEALIAAYANHTHNGWLELWLETGLAGLVLLAGFLVWLVIAGYAAWHGGGSAQERYLARASLIGIVLLLLHSAVDYPLRTTSLACVFALLCANLLSPTRRDGRTEKRRSGIRSELSRALRSGSSARSA